jgi:predicted  nucleic acid-binding Zn-ribbon protein
MAGRAAQAPAAATTAPLPAAVQRLQHDVQQQQQQSRQLRQRVDALERQQAQDRDSLQQRDSTIEALRRQLRQLAPAPAASAS